MEGHTEGVQVLKQGLIKRIGMGEQTDPWNDHWIPHGGMLRPLACLVNDPPSRVAEFIDMSTTTWNEEKLK